MDSTTKQTAFSTSRERPPRAPGRPPGGCATIVCVVAQGSALCCSSGGATKTGGRMSGVYEGLTVIELAARRNQWAGKLLADGGARVIQIEPIEGSPGRWTGPFVQDTPDADTCLDYWFNNTGKQSVALDLARTRQCSSITPRSRGTMA